MAYMQQRHFQQMWCSRNDTHIFTSVILYINIIFIAQWLPGGNSEILPGSDVSELCKPESIFKKTRVNFLPRKYDVISQLRHSTLRALFA